MINKIVRRRLYVLSIVISLLASMSAQTSLISDYDVAKPMTLKGRVSAMGGFMPAGYLYVRLDVADASGKVVQWALEGNSVTALQRAGWNVRPPNPTLRLGQELSVVVYLPKANAKLAERIPVSSDEWVLELAKAGRFAHGTELTLPDGKKLTFGDSQ